MSKAWFRFCAVIFAAAALFAGNGPARYATLDGMDIHYESFGAGRQLPEFLDGIK